MKNKGITLIALVITIIVLLILAGVSIAMLTGENGILTQAKKAKEETEKAQQEEQDILKDYENYLNDVTGDVSQVEDSNPGVLEGSGTEESPFVINSIEDLVAFADNVTKGTNTYQGQYVELGLSLDFNSDKSYVDSSRENYYGYEGKLKEELINGKGFQSIGALDLNDKENQFYGFFDGNNYFIKNLLINNIYTINAPGIGLFAYNYGTIKNIGLENININVEFKPELGSATAFIGGLVGRNEGDISNVYTKGNIYSISTGENNYREIRTGGICGQITSGKLENSYNTAKITTDGNPVESSIGGCVGTLSTDALLQNSYNIGDVKQYNNNAGIGVGGIVGDISQVSATLLNCYYLYGTCVQGFGLNLGTADSEENIVKSSEYMKSSEFLDLLNQNNSGMWKVVSGKNNGYPVLYWE